MQSYHAWPSFAQSPHELRISPGVKATFIPMTYKTSSVVSFFPLAHCPHSISKDSSHTCLLPVSHIHLAPAVSSALECPFPRYVQNVFNHLNVWSSIIFSTGLSLHLLFDTVASSWILCIFPSTYLPPLHLTLYFFIFFSLSSFIFFQESTCSQWAMFFFVRSVHWCNYWHTHTTMLSTSKLLAKYLLSGQWSPLPTGTLRTVKKTVWWLESWLSR